MSRSYRTRAVVSRAPGRAADPLRPHAQGRCPTARGAGAAELIKKLNQTPVDALPLRAASFNREVRRERAMEVVRFVIGSFLVAAIGGGVVYGLLLLAWGVGAPIAGGQG